MKVSIADLSIGEPHPVPDGRCYVHGNRGVVEGISNLTITVTYTFVVGLHHGRCERCNRDAPPPTREQLRELEGELLLLSGRYMAPRAEEDLLRCGDYLPQAWGSVDGSKILCGVCLPIVDAALRLAMIP